MKISKEQILEQLATIGYSAMLNSKQLGEGISVLIKEIETLDPERHPETKHPDLEGHFNGWGGKNNTEEHWYLKRILLQDATTIVVVIKEDIHPGVSYFGLWEVHLFPMWKSHERFMEFLITQRGWWSGPTHFRVPADSLKSAVAV